MKKVIISFGIILCGCAVGSLYVIWDLYHYAQTPKDTNATLVLFQIDPNASFRSVADKLYRFDIISDPTRFQVIARFHGYDKAIKTGEFNLSAAMTPIEILRKLVQGKVRLHRLTIPEGLTMHQIGKLVATSNLGQYAAFMRHAQDPLLAAKLDVAATTLEGYLFPETYFFPMGISPQSLIKTLVSRFWKVFNAEWKARAAQIGFSVHEVVTLASIIEKETGVPQERPLISSVFHNRLKKRMRLESDPTVIYGIKNFDGNLTKKHLKTKTPYNTYRIRGLPVGPIANPGKESLEAALYPARSTYLYFVAKKDRTHQFSTNIRDHNRAVRKYQLRRIRRKK